MSPPEFMVDRHEEDIRPSFPLDIEEEPDDYYFPPEEDTDEEDSTY